MFVRAKKSGAYHYLQLVHNQRVDGHVRQQVLATLGRLDILQETGQLDALSASCGRFAQHTAVLNAHRQGETEVGSTITIGPVLVFERLWRELGLAARGWRGEWERLKSDLDALEEVTVANAGKTFVLRSPVRGDAGKALQAVGVALGPTIRLGE